MNQATIESIKLGIFFFILFTAYMSFQNIVTHIYKNQGLDSVGPINIACKYIAFMISNTLATRAKLSFKRQMLIGCAGYFLNLSTGIYAPYLQNKTYVYIIVALGGIIGGATGGYLWVSQGGYMREICKNEKNKGKYSAIFQSIFCMSNLMAGLITTFFLGFFSEQIYFIVISLLVALSAVFCKIFIKNTSQSSSNTQNRSKEGPQPSILSEADIKHEDQRELQSSTSKSSQFSKTMLITLNAYKKMWAILIVLVIDGIALGIYSNQLPRLIPDSQGDSKEYLHRLAGIVNICSGTGSMVGGYVTGFTCDRIGLRMSNRLIICYFLFACGMTYWAIQMQVYGLVCFVGFLWGSTVFIVEGWMFVAILKIYKGKLQAFAVNKQGHCIAMAGFQILVIATENKFDQIIFLVVIGLLAIPWWLLVDLKVSYQQETFGKNIYKNSCNNSESSIKSQQYVEKSSLIN